MDGGEAGKRQHDFLLASPACPYVRLSFNCSG
jgi:hypothetical protein